MKTESVLNDPKVGKLLFKLSMPAIVGMLVMSLYNIVDTIFIGQGVGTNGIAGVTLAFPIQMIVGAIGQMVGIGGASLLSRCLGAGELEKARKSLGNVVALVVTAGTIITVIGYLNLDGMLKMFGATDTLLPYAREYLVIVLAGVVFHSLAMALNNLARAEGFAKVAMTTMIIAAVVNIILDAIFIFGFKMGIRGAAIATLISYIMAAVFLIYFFRTGRSAFKLRIRDIRFDWSISKEILAIGVASFIRQAAMSILVVLLNRQLGTMGGDISIAVYGIIMRLLMLIFTPIMGVAQGFQPIMGFNYGAQHYLRMKDTFKKAIFSSTLIAVFGTILLAVFPVALCSIFSSDQRLLQEGKAALHLVILALPLVGFQVIGTTLFQATGKALKNIILSLSRQVLFLIPLVLILPRIFKLDGIWMSFPIADVLSTILTFLMVMSSKDLFKPSVDKKSEELTEK